MIPNRRPTITETILVNGRKYHISASLDPMTGDVCEAWGYGPKPGSQAWAILQDVCWSLSKEMQDGREPEDFARYVMRDASGEPQSVKGVIVDFLCVLQQEVRNGCA